MRLLRILVVFSLLISQSGFSTDYPLYMRFIPYNPPNLHLRTTRATNAYYIPGVNPGTTFNFTLTPVLTSTLSLAEGPIPLVLQFFDGLATCRGTKVVTAIIRYNISGAVTTISSQTQTINITNAGVTIQTFSFGGLSAGQSYTLQTGDYVQLQIRHEAGGTGSACLVNEFPLNGVDTDASKVTLQTGPILSIQKLRALISDPSNGTTNPKSIPGATVRYTINITNDATASATANSVAFTDVISSDTAYNSNTITLNAAALTDATGDDAGEISGATISVNTGNITAGQTATIEYDVTVN